MNEFEFIQQMSKIREASDRQVNRTWESDSEIVRLKEGFLAVTTDCFSENEDFFQFTPPETIGRNIAWGTLADLCACGLQPQFILQNWNCDPSHPGDYYLEMAQGISSVLSSFGACSLGGDTGCSVPWSWTGTAFSFSEVPPVMRKASRRVPFKLYTAGAFGDANFALIGHAPMPVFECRQPVPQTALFGTDSSGGFFDAIENFRRVNPEMNLTLELDRIPYAVSGEFPPEFLLIGGVGEYELIFALPAEEEPPQNVFCIGFGDFSGPVVSLSRSGKKVGEMKNSPPDFRSVSPNEFLSTVQTWYGGLFS